MPQKRSRRHAKANDRGGAARQADQGPPGAERLQKVLAAAGVGSRRDCEELIREGRVEVDRQVVTELGTRVDPLSQEIRVDGEALRRPKRLYFAVNKPAGVVTTNYDQGGRPRVVDLVPTEERVFAVGRLDMASEGLILVTNDGEFANRLTHPRYGVSKTYLVRVAGAPSQSELARLRRGIHLAEGVARVNTLHVKGKHKGSTDMVIVLNEGRNREIRRILARVGHKVLRLKRIAVGKLKLADLPLGAWRRLMPQEIDMLLAEAQEQKRGGRKARQPWDKTRLDQKKPVSGRRERGGYLPQQAAMPPQRPAMDLEDDWEGDDDFLPGGEEEMIEVTDEAAPMAGPPPRGDVIDYEESPPAGQRPKKWRGAKKMPAPRGRKSQARDRQSGGRFSPPPHKGRRPQKNRRKGRR